MERIVKGIFIPLEIWQSRQLSWSEKVLLMEIDSFTSKGRDCFFSNRYIADLLGVKEDTASRLVSSLIKKGFIKMTRFDGRNRYLETCISIQSSIGENSESATEKSASQARINNQDNNISNKPNNKSSKDFNKNICFDFKKSLIALGITSTTADAWLQVRKAQRAVNTEIAFNAISREIEKAGRDGYTPEDCIRLAVEKSWRGFSAAWLDRQERRNPTPSPRPKANEDFDFTKYYK